jgi:hypothetical protein
VSDGWTLHFTGKVHAHTHTHTHTHTPAHGRLVQGCHTSAVSLSALLPPIREKRSSLALRQPLCRLRDCASATSAKHLRVLRLSERTDTFQSAEGGHPVVERSACSTSRGVVLLSRRNELTFHLSGRSVEGRVSVCKTLVRPTGLCVFHHSTVIVSEQSSELSLK